METYGTIFDKGGWVEASWRWYNTVTGEVYGSADNTHTFHVWADHDVDQIALEISAKGYKTVTVMATALLQPLNDVMMVPKPFATILLELSMVVALVSYAIRRHKKVGSVGMQDVVPFLLIGGGVLAFSLVKKILEGLGIWDSANTKDLNAAANSADSWWSPNYWQTIKPANKNWTYAITQSQAVSWCNELQDAFGWFNDCEECAIAIFKRMHTKANASFFSWVFNTYVGEDLLTYLRGGSWPQDRLSDGDVETINKYINTLPAY